MGGAGLVCAALALALAVDEAEAVCSMGDWAGLPPATCIGEREGLESDSGDSGSWSSFAETVERPCSGDRRLQLFVAVKPRRNDWPVLRVQVPVKLVLALGLARQLLHKLEQKLWVRR